MMTVHYIKLTTYLKNNIVNCYATADCEQWIYLIGQLVWGVFNKDINKLNSFYNYLLTVMLRV